MNINIANYSHFKPQYFKALCVFWILALFTLYSPQTHAQTAPIVLEIFTSKGCPACPVGDKIFNTAIQQNPDIIGLSCHVTYFDRGGRNDALSKPFCDARQSIYKLALKTGGIYTPMMIVNGDSAHKPKSINRAIDDAHTNTAYIPLSLNGNYLDIRLPRLATKNKADIWLFEIEKNNQRKGYSQYKNTVRNITKLLSWDGKSANMAFPVTPKANTRYAIIAQSYKDGIIAAGQTP